MGAAARARYEAFGAAWETFTVHEPQVHLNMIGVARSHRGQGLGRVLLDAVHGMSQDHPLSTGVSLTTEDPANVPLYEHVGYRVVGRQTVAEGVETWGFFRPDG